MIDPWLHFHKPLPQVSYGLRPTSQRFANDGIVRHFDYDAIITGTSMTENFKSSEFDQLFQTNSIKIPFAGARYKEISQNLNRVFEKNNPIKRVLWGVDYDRISRNAEEAFASTYPEYLYDHRFINDVSYVWNKLAWKDLAVDVWKTLLGQESMTFDEYSAWDNPCGKDAVLKNHKRATASDAVSDAVVQEEKARAAESIDKNLVATIQNQPETVFHLFITPYSIVYWDGLNQKNRIHLQMELEQMLIERLLTLENVELYCFFENTDLICDLNQYKDTLHYNATVNSKILEWIAKGEYRITQENYRQHLQNTQSFYTQYDYDSIFTQA